MAEACYKEPYIPSSFKGVSFKTVEATSEHGRRGAEGEFPFGEITGYADLGRKMRRYSVTARFDTNNHVTEAAALIAVVETPGPGPLLHPTRGIIIAACTGLRISDKIEEEGGVTYADMEFVEANNWPNGFALGGLLAGIVVGGVVAAARASFNSRYVPRAAQTFRQVAVVDSARQQVQYVVNAYALVTSSKLTDRQRNRIIAALQSIADSNVQATTASNVDRAISLGMNAIAQETVGQSKYDVFRSLANSAAIVSRFPAPAGDVENSIYSLVRVIAAAFMAEAVMESDSANTGQIFTEYDAIETVLQGEQDLARVNCDSPLFMAISDFKTNALAQLANKAYNSPGVVEYDFGGAVHPVSAAYTIYGDAKRHRELEQLNVITAYGRFPGHVFAQRT